MSIVHTVEQTVSANGITINYDTFGHPDHTPLLLVMGLGAQMIVWEEAFCEQLARHNLYVIRYDNRDVGLSSKIESGGIPNIQELLMKQAAGLPMEATYYLKDMAADGIALLDVLGIEKAHIMGASMGGMIVQEMAIHFPERVLSMISIMSTTGEPIEPATPEAMTVLLTPAPANRDGYIQSTLASSAVLNGNTFPLNEEKIRRRAARTFDRQYYPLGIARQLAAILASGSRTEALQQIDIPTLVIHGSEDPLVRPEGGYKTAEAVPNAKLLVIEGMGHNIPELVWDDVIGTIVEHIRTAASVHQR